MEQIVMENLCAFITVWKVCIGRDTEVTSAVKTMHKFDKKILRFYNMLHFWETYWNYSNKEAMCSY